MAFKRSMDRSPWHPTGLAKRVLVMLCVLCCGIAGTQASEAPLAGTRVSEASNPGPGLSFDDPEADCEPEPQEDGTEGHDWAPDLIDIDQAHVLSDAAPWDIGFSAAQSGTAPKLRSASLMPSRSGARSRANPSP